MRKHITIEELKKNSGFGAREELLIKLHKISKALESDVFYPRRSILTENTGGSDEGDEYYLFSDEKVIVFTRQPNEDVSRMVVLNRTDIKFIEQEMEDEKYTTKVKIAFQSGHELKMDSLEDANFHWNRKFQEMIEDILLYLITDKIEVNT